MDSLLVKSAVDLVTHFLKKRIDEGPRSRSMATELNVERHLREALSWSRRIQFLGMARAEETEAATIALRLADEPRRFRGHGTRINRTESDLLSNDKHYILLGDPGAGKTTTLKRLVRKLLLEEPIAISDHYQFPVVLRLRELEAGGSLVVAIAKALGVPYHRRRQDESTWYPGFWLGKARLEDAIADFLSNDHVVLLLDGLDELHATNQDRVRNDLAWLASTTTDSKIIASCRTGDYSTMIDGFDLMEICPLVESEVATIAALWLGEPGPFIDALARVPYGDIADRPLFLTQLLFLYRRYGYLPDQPSEVYRRVVSLLLQEWDAERGVVRQSRYAHFDPDRKAAFLSAIAYHLTVKVQKKVFRNTDLLEAYRTVHGRFQLPAAEARQVISEIETHTGIVTAAGYDTYEFSHLSLQEYLCADYLIRDPHAIHLDQYMASYPAPVAIAVALSSDPGMAFAALFLGSRRPQRERVASLLSRLMLERPFFDISPAFGVAIMSLYLYIASDASSQETFMAAIDNILSLQNAMESISAAFEYFRPDARVRAGVVEFVRLRRSMILKDTPGFQTPEHVYVPEALLTDMYGRGDPRAAALMIDVGLCPLLEDRGLG